LSLQNPVGIFVSLLPVLLGFPLKLQLNTNIPEKHLYQIKISISERIIIITSLNKIKYFLKRMIFNN